MSERWGDSQRDRDALDEWITREPDDEPEIEPGSRIRLIMCGDPFTTLQPGTEGTVKRIDDVGTVHVAWDDGRNLGLVFDEDEWEMIS